MSEENQNQMTDEQQKNWRNLENRAKTAEQEAEAAKQQAELFKTLALEGVARNAGYDPQQGVVRMVVESYAKSAEELTPSHFNPSKFSEFAAEQGLGPAQPQNPQNAGEGSQEEGSAQPTPGDFSGQLEQFQQQAQQLSNLAVPDNPPATKTEQVQKDIADAERAGDWHRALNLKNQLMLSGNTQPPPAT